ncbi:MAG: hypothetical protein HC880_19985 [Bacteroidia bacterium]|nr:hypothetical protein [Bacteroidia bacterium]
MKKTLILLLLALVGCSLNQAPAQSIFDKWEALDSFHEVMAQTFHPSEEGNLEPIKTRSGEMAKKADALAKTPIPDEFASAAIQSAVKQLQKDSKMLHKLIKSKQASDEQITKSLSALHDVFHEIVGLCKDENH